jgi:hypothetical protein
MRNFVVLGLLLLPAACGLAPGDYLMPDEECRQVTYADPVVREREARYLGVQNAETAALNEEERNLKRETYLRCMRSHGRAPLGGVQPVRKY